MARVLTEEQLLVWEDRISRQASSGLTVAEFCRQEQISAANFHFRKRKLMGAVRHSSADESVARRAQSVASASSFFQLPVAESCSVGTWIEIVSADGTLIRLPQENLAAFEIALTLLPGRPH